MFSLRKAFLTQNISDLCDFYRLLWPRTFQNICVLKYSQNHFPSICVILRVLVKWFEQSNIDVGSLIFTLAPSAAAIKSLNLEFQVFHLWNWDKNTYLSLRKMCRFQRITVIRALNVNVTPKIAKNELVLFSPIPTAVLRSN